MRYGGVTIVVLLGWVSAAGATPDPAAYNDLLPDDLVLGRALSQVSEVYPNLPVARGNLGAAYVDAEMIDRRSLKSQNLKNLSQPIDLELRFWKGALWVVIVYFGENSDDEVLAALEGALGTRKSQSPHAMWELGETTVTAEIGDRWYSIQLNRLSSEAQAWLLQQLRSGHPKPTRAAEAGEARPAQP